MQVNLVNKTRLNYNYPYELKYNNKSTFVTHNDIVSFSGLKDKDSKCLFVFDIDGTFAHGTTKEIDDVLKLKDERNATLVYATGRTLKKFKEKQKKLSEKGIIIPDPDFLVARNGLYIYENKDGELIEDKNWDKKLIASFPKEKITNIVKEIASRPEYKMNACNFKTEEQAKKKSKICPYKFWPSPKMIEIICDASIVDEFQEIISKELQDRNIHFKLIKQTFGKEECDQVCTKTQLEVIEPRYDENNSVTQVDIVAADKADGIKYIKNKLKIPYEEIVMAGNDENDISMANLSLKGAYFICVANALDVFKKYLNGIKNKTDNLLFPEQEGTSGIFEGINTILAMNGEY